jgi:hypothetical protein
VLSNVNPRKCEGRVPHSTIHLPPDRGRPGGGGAKFGRTHKFAPTNLYIRAYGRTTPQYRAGTGTCPYEFNPSPMTVTMRKNIRPLYGRGTPMWVPFFLGRPRRAAPTDPGVRPYAPTVPANTEEAGGTVTEHRPRGGCRRFPARCPIPPAAP